ncbi:MAG: hypothetical protein ACOCXR_00230 [Phototrophicaceae bacterium]
MKRRVTVYAGAAALLLGVVFSVARPGAAQVNCDGLLESGLLAPGTYEMQSNCVVTASLEVSGVVTINGNGYAIDGNGGDFSILRSVASYGVVLGRGSSNPLSALADTSVNGSHFL